MTSSAARPDCLTVPLLPLSPYVAFQKQYVTPLHKWPSKAHPNKELACGTANVGPRGHSCLTGPHKLATIYIGGLIRSPTTRASTANASILAGLARLGCKHSLGDHQVWLS